jgi:CRP/FNR family cyclic AMP-dependent transcriptional regulator
MQSEPTGDEVVTPDTADPKRAAGNVHVCESADPCVECLARSSVAAELADDQVDALFRIARIRRLSKGDVLISEGESHGPLFVVARGELEVAGNSGISLARLGPGMMAGQLTFVDGLKRTATVTASRDGTCVFAIERSDIESMLKTDPLLVYRVMRAILRSATATVDDMNKEYAQSLRYIRG